MPDPIQKALKVVLFFRSGGDGWSETYYTIGQTVDNVYAAIATVDAQLPAAGTVGEMVQARLKCLAADCSIEHVRVSVDGTFRQEDAVTLTSPFNRGKYKSTPPDVVGDASMDIQLSLLLRSVGTDVANQIHHSNTYLGGCPQTILKNSTYVRQPSWIPFIDNFMGILTNGPWLMKKRPDVNSVLGAPLPITAFTVSADGLTATIAPDVIGAIVPKGTVIIRGLKVPRGWNGSHSGVFNANAFGLALPGTVIGPLRKAGVSQPAFTTRPTGTIQLSVPEYFAHHRVDDEDIVKHARGRFFGQPRGRRS